MPSDYHSPLVVVDARSRLTWPKDCFGFAQKLPTYDGLSPAAPCWHELVSMAIETLFQIAIDAGNIIKLLKNACLCPNTGCCSPHKFCNITTPLGAVFYCEGELILEGLRNYEKGKTLMIRIEL